jgi:uncharacterized protein (DUF2147 family)
MSKKYSLRVLLLLIIVLLTRTLSFAQADQIERTWLDGDKKGKIQIYKAVDGKYYGKIIWLKEPDRDGKPKTDIHNPDDARHNDPVMGLLILKNFKKDGEKGYEGGTIYDPKNGKTYKCKMTYEGDHLNVRGYIGISLIGRTEVWTKAD